MRYGTELKFILLCGAYDFTGEDLFYLELVRQFVFEEEEEYDHMEQLIHAFHFRPNTGLQGLKTHLWTYDCNSVDEFFNKVENMDYFRVPIGKYIPFECRIKQEEV
ncbi:MAG: hypothetical protein GX359_00660 [Clostridiales bacterium]|nr:hypothetical protein [Clostridiales bacterium]